MFNLWLDYKWKWKLPLYVLFVARNTRRGSSIGLRIPWSIDIIITFRRAIVRGVSLAFSFNASDVVSGYKSERTKLPFFRSHSDEFLQKWTHGKRKRGEVSLFFLAKLEFTFFPFYLNLRFLFIIPSFLRFPLWAIQGGLNSALHIYLIIPWYFFHLLFMRHAFFFVGRKEATRYKSEYYYSLSFFQIKSTATRKAFSTWWMASFVGRPPSIRAWPGSHFMQLCRCK